MIEKFDVVVTGAGMVGATAACLFARQGLQVALLDSQMPITWNAQSFYPRVSAINLASMKVFQHLGVWQLIENMRAHRYHAMQVWEHQSDAHISFDSRTMALPQLGFIVENSAIITALLEKLQQNYNVRYMPQTVLQRKQSQANGLLLSTQQNQDIFCELLVGADGAKSKVREICDIDSQTFDYEQDAIVTTVELDSAHKNTAWQAFLQTGPVALLPLQDGRCSIVWSGDHAFSRNLMQLSDETFCNHLSNIFEGRPGKILACEKRHIFPLRQHHADHYINTNTALIGDAAHVTHPLAGLGANLGLMDAAALAEVVSQSLSRRKPIGSYPNLRRYERWRKGENAIVLKSMKAFKSTFGHSASSVKNLRRLGLNLADQITPVKNQLAKFATGLSGDLPQICK